MYLDFYGIVKEPFHITPDPEFLFLSPSHKEALGAMIYGVEQRKGFVAVTGEVGLGKTTVLRSFLEKLDEEHVRTVIVFNANVSYKGLLKLIYRELGLELSTDDVFEMVDGLHEVLIEEYKANRNVVLIIDEAQNMPVETLENLRMLSNLETSKDKLLQILLIGQPELEAVLDRRELRQFKQRLAVRGKLAPLSPEESLAYIRHRVERSGGRLDEIFDRAALKAIVQAAQGIPRRINVVCDNALITGYGYHKKPVTGKIVREVIADLEGKSPPSSLRWVAVVVMVLAVLGALLWVASERSGDFLETARKVLQGGWGGAGSVTGGAFQDPSPRGDQGRSRTAGSVAAEPPVTVVDPGEKGESAPNALVPVEKSAESPAALSRDDPVQTLDPPIMPAGQGKISAQVPPVDPAGGSQPPAGPQRGPQGQDSPSPLQVQGEPTGDTAEQSGPPLLGQDGALPARDPGDAIEWVLRKRSGDRP